jgi:hypothetical protein
MIKLLTLITLTVTLNGQVLIDHYRGITDGNELLTGLQAYYEFENTSDGTLDSSVNVRHLTKTGTITDEVGAILRGRNHNSADDTEFYSIADAAWQDLDTNDFTMTLFYRPTSASLGSILDQTFISKGGPGNCSFWLGFDKGGAYANGYAFYFAYGDGAGFEIPLLVLEMEATHGVEEFFVYVKREGDDFELGYAAVDEAGILHTTTTTLALTFQNSTEALSIGNWLIGSTTPHNGYDAEGVIDQVGIWNVALSNCQLNKVRNKMIFSQWDADACN